MAARSLLVQLQTTDILLHIFCIRCDIIEAWAQPSPPETSRLWRRRVQRTSDSSASQGSLQLALCVAVCMRMRTCSVSDVSSRTQVKQPRRALATDTNTHTRRSLWDSAKLSRHCVCDTEFGSVVWAFALRTARAVHRPGRAGTPRTLQAPPNGESPSQRAADSVDLATPT